MNAAKTDYSYFPLTVGSSSPGNSRNERTEVWQSIAYYGVLLVESVLRVFGIRLYEEPRYDVINLASDRVEIRRYGPLLAAEVDLAVAGEAGRSEAFKRLFAYIAGANRASISESDRIAMTVPVEVSGKEKLAMTVPVQTSETNGTLKMRFFLPAKYSLENAPKPLNLGSGLSQLRTRRLRSCVFPARATISQNVRPN